MKDFVEIAQIITGFAAIVSIFFTVYAFRSQKIDKQLDTAKNISSWNVTMAKDKQESLSKEANPGFDGETFTDEWHNAPNCTNITVNKNPFPVYNLIIVFVPNHLKFKGNNSLSSQYQCFYYEILTPGKIITDFVNDHTMGSGHLIPELYFTDTQNNQWRRSKNGELKKTAYLKKAVKLGIIQKHL